MKKIPGLAVIVCLMLIVVPFIIAGGFPEWEEILPGEPTESDPPPVSADSASAAEEPTVATGLAFTEEKAAEGFVLYDTASDKLLKVSATEFLYGAVACEMPLSFADEALKAQAVACHSYYARKRETERANPQKELKGGDFAVDTKAWSIYTTKAQMEKKWGDNFEKNYQRLTSLVDSVAEVVMTYEGEPIVAVFHAQSGGMTENAFNVWGTEYPYLTAVNSPGDLLAPEYQTETTFPAKDFKAILEKRVNGIKLEGSPKSWIGEITKTPSGTVIMCGIGDRKASGSEMRSFFSLRSAVFDLTYKDGRFVFNVLGHGHGVGMSQYGAQEMAKQGAGYREILSWYYKIIK